ncbi:zinc-ribbon domain-containing protein [Streptomyces sp. MB09-01]|uniref:zinc-ribbon domain-containing protein n=1 Tax=Streptomyces sp. MB09-01 TaxID=3028666 RepID=UPI0029CA97FF|nr:zinc-ribbon domain-containing protein [Streptomyces sp. MB09-01]
MNAWLAELNEGLDPTRLTIGSAKYAHLRCRGCGVPYQVQIRHFMAGRTCQRCGIARQMLTSRRPAKGRSIAELRPDLAAEWDSERNEVSATEVAAQSNTPTRWWRCPADDRHRYDMPPSERWRGSGCPYCSGRRAGCGNDLATVYPKLAAEWVAAPDRPGLTPSDVTPFSATPVFWRCLHDDRHQWTEKVSQRTNRPSCPFCSGSRIDATNNLAVRRPDLVAEWHPGLNGSLRPEDVGPGSHRKTHWRCGTCGHVWTAAIAERTGSGSRAGTGCPPCSLGRRGQTRRRPPAGQSFADLAPDLAREWHPTRNAPFTPADVRPGTPRPKRWWKCDAGHEWLATVASRVAQGRGCGFCAGQRATPERNLAVADPNMAATWHPRLNGALRPTDVLPASGRTVHWLCENGHTWKQQVSNRVRSRHCGECAGRRVTRSNNLAAKHPDLAVEWDRAANWPLQPHQVLPGSNMTVTWRCSRGHTWEAVVVNRTRLSSGCSRCQMSATSVLEIRLYAELAFVLSRCGFTTEHDVRLTDPKIPARYRSVDMLFVDDGGGIAIEFDGSYWHAAARSRADRDKTDALLNADYGVLRVRETPLECLGPEELPVSKNQQPHLTAAAVLKRMLEMDWIRSANFQIVEDYFSVEQAMAEHHARQMIHERGGYDLAASAAALRARAGDVMN